jgi:hypothetical protein
MLNTPSVVTVPAIGAEQLWPGKIVENGQQQEGATHCEDKAQPPWIDNVISQFEDLKPKVIAYKHRERVWSMSEYVDKIGSLMSLKESLPSSLWEQLGPDSSELKQMAMEFAPLCVKLRIWSFVETIDSSSMIFPFQGMQKDRLP